MITLFHTVSEQCSRTTTETYSTSFFSAIKLLHADLRQPIFNIYGFVRFADEIVDTFHHFNKAQLLQNFKTEAYLAIDQKISLNPILNSFQRTVNKYNIDKGLIDAFFISMEMDLTPQTYNPQLYQTYIYGSAEVVGLMCLYVFCDGNKEKYESLKNTARSLGAAFQKVNFLRDVKADYNGLDRIYFPGCNFNDFNNESKRKIEEEIEADFKQAYEGIMQLPMKAKFGVYVSYKYYMSLFKKIKRVQPERILEKRIRVPNYMKAMIVLRAGLKNQLNLL
jgi:15-cis-phytoene synthase